MSIEISPAPPPWLTELIRIIGEQFRPLGFIGQLGFRYLQPGVPENSTRRWLIGVYLVPHELSGGKHDGSVVVAGFCFNLQVLLDLFSDITALEWRVPRSYADGFSGPEVWLEGNYMGTKPVQLHIYADSPADEAPSLVLDVGTGVLRPKE